MQSSSHKIQTHFNVFGVGRAHLHQTGFNHSYYGQWGNKGHYLDSESETDTFWHVKEFAQVIQYGSIGQEFSSDKDILARDEYVVHISGGDSHSLFVTNHRRVFCCGNNANGRCALPELISSVEQVTLIPELTDCNIVETKCGNDFSFFVSEGYDCVYVAGNKKYGRCGLTNTERGISTITKMESVDGKKLKLVEPGSFHTVFVTVDNCVYTSGYCALGSLGQSHFSQQSSVPVKVDHPDLGSGLVAIKSVACGQWHSIVITEEGSAYSWGFNYHNQCGLITSSSEILSPVLITGVLSSEKIVDAKCGESFTVFRTESNQFYCCGVFYHDAFLPPTQISLSIGTVLDYNCGANLTVFTTKEGNAYALGDPREGFIPLSIQEHSSSTAQDSLVVTEVRLPWDFHNSFYNELHVACAKNGYHAFLYGLAKSNSMFTNKLFVSQRKGQLCDMIVEAV